MKKIIAGSMMSAFLLVTGISASPEAGKELMKSTGCNVCHKINVDQIKDGMGSSLVNIKAAYADGGKAALVSFLKGEAEPRIEPERFATMKAFVLKTKKMTDAERESIADYILSVQ